MSASGTEEAAATWSVARVAHPAPIVRERFAAIAQHKRKGFEGMNRETVRLILKKRHETLEEKDVVHPEDR